jgi:hypothetical protein
VLRHHSVDEVAYRLPFQKVDVLVVGVDDARGSGAGCNNWRGLGGRAARLGRFRFR